METSETLSDSEHSLLLLASRVGWVSFDSWRDSMATALFPSLSHCLADEKCGALAWWRFAWVDGTMLLSCFHFHCAARECCSEHSRCLLAEKREWRREREEGSLHRADGAPSIEENRPRESVEKRNGLSVICLNGSVSVILHVFGFE